MYSCSFIHIAHYKVDNDIHWPFWYLQNHCAWSSEYFSLDLQSFSSFVL